MAIRHLVFAAFAVTVPAAFAFDFVNDVRQAIALNQLPAAERMVETYKSQKGATPEMIEALSWVSRADAVQKRYPDADRNAKEVIRLATAQMAKQAGHLDAEPHLPLAVGAAIEVVGQVMAARGARDQ